MRVVRLGNDPGPVLRLVRLDGARRRRLALRGRMVKRCAVTGSARVKLARRLQQIDEPIQSFFDLRGSAASRQVSLSSRTGCSHPMRPHILPSGWTHDGLDCLFFRTRCTWSAQSFSSRWHLDGRMDVRSVKGLSPESRGFRAWRLARRQRSKLHSPVAFGAGGAV